MTNARALTRELESAGIKRRGPGAIYAFAMDAHNAVCLTEAMLDEWFHSLKPEQKAEIYEHQLEGDPLELQLHEGMLRGSLSDVVDRIDRHAALFAEAYRGGQ